MLDEVQHADYVIFLMKATSPGTESEEELRQRLQSYSTPGILALSHWDHVDEEEQKEVEAHAKAFAAKAFPGKETKLFCINGKKAEKAIKAGGKHDEPGCQELERFLEEKLADKNRQLAHKLTGSCSRAAGLVAKHSGQIGIDEKETSGAYKEAMKDLKQERDELKQEQKRLSEKQREVEKDQKDIDSEIEANRKDYNHHVREKQKTNSTHGGWFLLCSVVERK